MSTIQITETWQSKPTNNLVESFPVKEGKKLSAVDDTVHRSRFCAMDVMGLSWVLLDDLEGDF